MADHQKRSKSSWENINFRELRYNLEEMLSELPRDKESLQLGHQLVGQDEIGKVFKFNLRKDDSRK